MARRPQQGHRPPSAPGKPSPGKPSPAPPPKGRRGGTGQAPATAPAMRRIDFDTSRLIPRFRTTLNHHQEAAWDLMGDRRAVLLVGPAGTAKTHCAVARAMHELVAARSVGRLVLVRPAVEAGEKIGFLPGGPQEKLDPFFRPVYDIINELVGYDGRLREQVQECLEIAPVGFMRGRTFKDSFVVLDEAQNCTWAQLKMVMSRLGKGSKIAVTGDPDQSDLPHTDRFNPLARLRDNIRRKNLDSKPGALMGCYSFPESAIVRDEVVADVLRAFDDGLDADGWPTGGKQR